MESKEIIQLIKLFEQWQGVKPEKVEKLPASGSDRQYFRMKCENISVLGAYNTCIDENIAYVAFTKVFKDAGVSVPEVFCISDDKSCYLVEDIGDDSLYKKLLDCDGQLTDEVLGLMKKSLNQLLQMQIDAGSKIDYSLCYPVAEFDETAIQWDLNYFKYNFLKLSGNEFNELDLEKDFQSLKKFLLAVPRDYFMFRDFQSRNILIRDNAPVFIDFQGGRKGPLTYDVASLLYQAKARLTEQTRNELFDDYYKDLSKKITVDYSGLYQSFKGFALLRTLQVLGAYGFRGYFEKKPHFIESIPFAIENLKQLLLNDDFPISLPTLKSIAQNIVLPKMMYKASNGKLTVSITSFSYRKGIPADPSENGGGYVFDCRSIHNPGRYKEYQHLTGMDKEVQDFFEREDEMENFLNSAFALVNRSVDVYLERGFKHLMVNFGCTGGQHRSVYSAERLKKHLQQKYPVNVNLWHREQD